MPVESAVRTCCYLVEKLAFHLSHPARFAWALKLLGACEATNLVVCIIWIFLDIYGIVVISTVYCVAAIVPFREAVYTGGRLSYLALALQAVVFLG